jgi:hypothetical protein
VKQTAARARFWPGYRDRNIDRPGGLPERGLGDVHENLLGTGNTRKLSTRCSAGALAASTCLVFLVKAILRNRSGGDPGLRRGSWRCDA